MDKIRQIFFRQICVSTELAKFSHRQSFPPYGSYVLFYWHQFSLSLKAAVLCLVLINWSRHCLQSTV